MQAIKLRDVKPGDYVKRKADAKAVYIKGDYCRTDKRYALQSWDDHCREVRLKADTVVFIGFEF